MRPGRLGSFTGGWGGAGVAWVIVCGKEGLSKSSYRREGLRMRFPELQCWSNMLLDNPSRELKSEMEKPEEKKAECSVGIQDTLDRLFYTWPIHSHYSQGKKKCPSQSNNLPKELKCIDRMLLLALSWETSLHQKGLQIFASDKIKIK